MLELADIKIQALKIAQDKLGSGVKDVDVVDDFDHEGRPSLRVTIILKSTWSGKPPGNKLNEISRELRTFLSNRGEERFAYTHYMTKGEFLKSDDLRKPTSRSRRATG